MEIKDLAGLSQPLTKLIEVIAQGVGGVTQPYLIRKNAEARAHELRVIAEAQAHNRRLLADSEYVAGHVTVRSDAAGAEIVALPERAQARNLHNVLREQANVEGVCAAAVEAMGADPVTSNSEVEPDWITRFFKLAEEITSEEMQQLWGRILAGQVRRPGSVSLRTLEVLRNLSRNEAELFCRVAKLAMGRTDSDVFFVINPEKFLENVYDLSFSDLLLLKELGLIHQEPHLNVTLTLKDSGQQWWEHGGYGVVFQWQDKNESISIPILKFTRVGTELLQLVPADFDQAYVEKFCSFFQRVEGTFVCGRIHERTAKGITLHPLRPILVESGNMPNTEPEG